MCGRKARGIVPPWPWHVIYDSQQHDEAEESGKAQGNPAHHRAVRHDDEAQQYKRSDCQAPHKPAGIDRIHLDAELAPLPV